MSKNKKRLVRIIVSGVIFAACMIAFKLTPLRGLEPYAKDWRLNTWQFYVYAMPFLFAYALVGYDVIYKAVKNLFTGKWLDENFLMTAATVGAVILCDLGEAVGVMLFYQVGELFQSYAVGKTRRSISELMDICPETACVLRGGEEQTVFPEEVEIGETLIVRAGERIPVDGIVVSGSGSVDTASITGESVPRDFVEGDTLLSGCINLNGVIKIRAEKAFEDSTVSKILDLVENASSKKAKAENFITKFARYYTPAVVFTALALAVLPPLFTHEWAKWITRALTFLVVSCPCALIISVPLAFFGGIGGASRCGILIKGGNYIEMLADCKTVVFDKTGTLTKGEFKVAGVYPEQCRDEILALASICESGSLHPIARSILNSAPKTDAEGYALKEVAGKGVIAEGNGKVILCGNLKLMQDEGIEVKSSQDSATAVHVAADGEYLGYITVEDTVKENAKDVIDSLKQSGCKTYMLTGDNRVVAEKVAETLDLDGFSSGLLPQDKVERVTQLLAEKQKGQTLMFVGDGINDAPVLAIADVGVSMGGIGSDAAIEASDVVLMRDDLSTIPQAKKIATKAMRIVKQNIVFALAVKGAVLLLSAFGLTGMWLAVFADVGVAVLAILNSMRTLIKK